MPAICPICRGTMRWINERFVCPVCGYDDTPELKSITNADRIRAMSDEELAEFLEWEVPYPCCDPNTGIDCERFDVGCANNCPHDKRTENMLELVQSEWNG